MRAAAETVVRSTIAGFLYGAIVYGGVIAIAHILYNPIDRVGDALVLLVWFFALYGLGAPAICAAGARGRGPPPLWASPTPGAVRVSAPRRGPVPPAAPAGSRHRVPRGGRDDSLIPLVGITTLNLLFW